MAKKTPTREEILEAKINTYLELKVQFDELDAKIKTLKADLGAEALGTEARTIVVGSHSVAVVERTRNDLDVKAFREAHPRLAKKFARVTKYDVVTIR